MTYEVVPRCTRIDWKFRILPPVNLVFKIYEFVPSSSQGVVVFSLSTLASSTCKPMSLFPAVLVLSPGTATSSGHHDLAWEKKLKVMYKSKHLINHDTCIGMSVGNQVW